MLVLSRRKDEKLTLFTSDGDIEIIVIKFKQGAIKLGIKAPKSVRVLRNEILKQQEEVR